MTTKVSSLAALLGTYSLFIVQGGETLAGGSFSKATFQVGVLRQSVSDLTPLQASGADAAVDVNAPDFWEQMLPDVNSPGNLLVRLREGWCCRRAVFHVL